MGQVHIDLDLVCAGCSSELRIEDSAGTHVLVIPCITCTQNKVEQLADEKAQEEIIPDDKVQRDATAAQWKADKERIQKEKDLINGVQPTTEEEGFDE